jgi:hypothetical protein
LAEVGDKDDETYPIEVQGEKMNKSTRFILFGIVSIVAVFMAACNAALPAGAEAKLSADGQSAQVEFTGVVDSIAADQWVVSGQLLIVTPQTVIDGSISVDNTVKVYATVTADGAVTADKIELPISESSTAVPQSTLGAFDDSMNEFTGIVEAISADSWQVSGQAFAFTSQTEVKDNILVGDLVKIHFLTNPDGTMTATEIELAIAKTPDTESSLDKEFTGKVEAFSPESWTVKGQVFLVTPQTEIKDAIFLGDVVKIHYFANPDGSFTAREIELAGDNQAHSSEKKLTGILEQISPTQATIGGVVVLITPQTELDSGLVIGQNVKAEVVTGSDGKMTALEIETFNNAPGNDDKDDSNKGNSGNNGKGSDSGSDDDDSEDDDDDDNSGDD